MSSTEYLNYESGKFSKSRGVGVFGTDARETGIPADVWRFYIYYSRPESSDATFTWKDFQEKTNGELIGNLSNLVNRTLTFVARNYGGALPEGPSDESFWADVRAREAAIGEALERVELRGAFLQIFALSSAGNKRFQDGEPWKAIKDNPAAAAGLLRDLVYLIRDLAVLTHPYIPETSAKIAAFLGLDRVDWADLGRLEGVSRVGAPSLLFRRLEDEEIEGFRRRFAGSQQERAEASRQFAGRVDLRVARIEAIERHPKADKLYVETVSLGPLGTRQIVSGLVPYYKPEELLGRNVILAANLAPAKLRGVESNGMLLAAQTAEIVEVVFVPQAQPGDRVTVEGTETAEAPSTVISIDEFFQVPIKVADYLLTAGGKRLLAAGRPIAVARVESGDVR